MPAVLSRRPRAQQRSVMTREDELAALIAEQAAADTYFIDRPQGHVSLEAPLPDGTVIGDIVGRDPWPLIDDAIDLGLDATALAYSGDFTTVPLPPLAPMAHADQHGTIYAYRRLRCRCVPCTAAQATAVREYRAARRAA